MRVSMNHVLTVVACALVAGGALAGPPSKFTRPGSPRPTVRHAPVKILTRVPTDSIVLPRFNSGGLNLDSFKIPSANKSKDIKRPVFSASIRGTMGKSINSASRTFKATQPTGPSRFTPVRASGAVTRVVRK